MPAKKENMNMSVWENLAPVDKQFTKKITGKSYGGDSPNPTYVIKKLTDVFGPIGQTWGFNVVSEKIRYGRPHQIVTKQRIEYGPKDGEGNPSIVAKDVQYELVFEQMHQIEIEFWQIVDGERRTFSAFGGTPLLYKSRNEKWIHDEDAAKKSLTDAYTKGASWLGSCADIFLGIFDDKLSGSPPEQDEDSGSPSTTSDSKPSGSRQMSDPGF